MALKLREVIQLSGRPMTRDELIKALEAGGADLGTYPKRSVQLGISNRPDMFEETQSEDAITGEKMVTVSLTEVVCGERPAQLILSHNP